MNEDIRFFGKTNPEYQEFSNFWLIDLNIDNRTWTSVEHFYQAMKTHDLDMQEDIRTGRPLGTLASMKDGTIGVGAIEIDGTPAFAKKQGQLVVLRPDWDARKDEVMRAALKVKFAHPALKLKLLSTKQRKIIEASPKDFYWGEGADGTGKNRLGILLMELRDLLFKRIF